MIENNDTPIVNRTYGTRLKDYPTSRRGLEVENFDLISKVLELLNTHDLWGDDDTYCFTDGERWAKHKGVNDGTSD